MTRLEENGRRTGCSGTLSTPTAVRWCITARKNSNALSIRPAASSTASLRKLSPKPLSYPQIPRKRLIFERPGKSIESFALLQWSQRSAQLQLAATKRTPEKSEELSPEL